MTSGVSELDVNMGMRSVPMSDTDCHAYDIYTHEWKALPDVPIGKLHPVLVVISNRYVFQIGGFDDYDFDIYRLDMTRPKLPWKTLSLDTREPIVDRLIFQETRSYMLEVEE